MKIEIKDLHADDSVNGRGYPFLVTLMAREKISMSNSQTGFLEGKKSLHEKGVFFQGGIINPGWRGKLSIEMIVWGEIDIKEGDEIAHAIIFTEGDQD